MWVRLCRRSLALALAALVALPASGQAASPPSPWQRVADAYAPIMMVRKQEDPPCDTDGEQYEPTSVSTVLGNPSVLLERDVPGKKRPVFVRAGPTAADIAGLGFEYYLDLPGDPLGDTCVYARDFQKLKKEGRAPTVVYAHIAHQNGHPGFALQYWFFWYFNEFNDLHEADWEGMQLNFDDADTPEAALSEGPSEVVLFQHAGAERAGWDDAKVEKDGRHPMVYPAAGSHATFYNSGVYVGNGGHGSGVGCDYTSRPLRELRPRVILMPDDATDKGPFAWLSYYGKWGQKAAGFNNGVDGPQKKRQWFDPFLWTEDQRESSVRLPGGTLVGPQVAAAFCGAVAAVSGVLNAQQKASTRTLVILGVVLRAIVSPLLLVATVVLSFAAALGVSALVFDHLFGFAGADPAFPLWTFVFLVALGTDYNIFLMTRVHEESKLHGTRRGALIGLAATGGVITSAGIVLAGTFAALGTLPLVFVTEIGFAVAFGVLLDTFVVRSVLVTALNLDVGRHIWWPSKLARKPDVGLDELAEEEPAAVTP